MQRRTFLSTPAMAAMGANDRVRIGLIGAGGRGTFVMQAFLASDCSVAAVCDVFEPNAEQAVAKAKSSTGGSVDSYGDYRRVLDRKDIDAVLIATPDHWHCPITIAACEAGKDVYVEKPLSNQIEPCVQAVAAARKHNRVVQVGLQQRSTPLFDDARKLIQDGLLGKVTHAACLYASGYTRAPEEPQSPPAGLDWDMFQGPAPRRAYVPSRQRSWRSFYDYGGGIITDWGVHLVDVVHWYLREDTPRTAVAAAQYVRYPCPERDQVPDAVSLAWTYDRFVMSFANWTPPNSEHTPYGNYFAGEKGTLLVNRSGYLAKPIRPRALRNAPPPPMPFEPMHYTPPPQPGPVDQGTLLHVRNFLECVRSRQRPACDIEIGFHSTLPTLLAIQAIRQERTIKWPGG